MSQTVVFKGIAAASAVLLLPAAYATNAEFRVITHLIGHPWASNTGYDDATNHATLIKMAWTPEVVSTAPTRPVLDGQVPNATADREVVMQRLAKVRSLSDGWVGPGSVAPDAHLLDWLELHSDLVASSSHVISIVPVEDGALALQWTADACEYTAELRPDNHMFLYVDNTVTDEFSERTADLDAEALGEFIVSGTLA